MEDGLPAGGMGAVRRNGGAAGVDGVTVADIEAYGVERWTGELSRDLRDGTYKPSPVRQVLIRRNSRGSSVPWASHAWGTGLRRRRQCWC